ncbi:cupin domain-containing protein [Xanthobacteraceae bacterium A53D]
MPLDFSHLVSPHGISEFLDAYWEKKPLVIARNDPDHYGALFDIRDIDRVLTQSQPTYPQIRLLSKATGVAWDALSEGWLGRSGAGHLGAVHEAYADGNSVVIEMRRMWGAVDRLCRSAEALLHHKASAELYLTPKGSQAFDIHYDLHDVFLLQLDGRKEWRVYDPVFPFPTAEATPNPLCGHLVGEPTHTLTLNKGDLLYMPRGFPHQGLTSDEPSLHITIGIYPYRMHDLIVRALALASADHEILRQSLPVGFLNGVDRNGLRSRLRACLAVLDDAAADNALDSLGQEFLDGLPPVPDGQIAELNHLPSMTCETWVERRAHMPCFVREAAGEATLQFPGGRLQGPASLRTAFQQIAATEGPFSAAELPDDLSRADRLLVVRRLVRDGLLRTRVEPRHARA